MPVIQLRRGLDIPIHGRADSAKPTDRLTCRRVGLLPKQEAPGLKPRVFVEVGDNVQIGQPLFCDRRDEKAVFSAPAAGVVQQINRGERRSVVSLVIASDGPLSDSQVDFPDINPLTADAGAVREALLASGFWPCLRQRPYDVIAPSDADPAAIFVSAADTSPLAPSPLELVDGRENAFRAGLQVLRRLTSGPVHLCTMDAENWGPFLVEGVQHQIFKGPHPAGNIGVQIHHVLPVGARRHVWHINAQDVADIGQLFLTRRFPVTTIVAITGPAAKAPKFIRTRRGASMLDLLEGEIDAAEARVVNGSPLGGPTATPGTETGFLGRYNAQVTLLEDKVERELLTWALPVSGRFTQTNTVFDKFFRKRFNFNTDKNGSLRAIVPIGQYESVLPMDILATQMVKALASHDMELAEKLGVLELAEEDLALLEFVDPSKLPLTELLRDMLEAIQKDA